MRRINLVTKEGKYEGWFNADTAITICSCQNSGGPYINGVILLKTTKGKLVYNIWSNSGTDRYECAVFDENLAKVLIDGEYDGSDPELIAVIKEFEEFDEFEV